MPLIRPSATFSPQAGRRHSGARSALSRLRERVAEGRVRASPTRTVSYSSSRVSHSPEAVMKALLLSLFVATNALAAGTSGFGLQVLVSGEPRPEYNARGNVYVEAIRGSEYSLRVTNPTPYRVAVALSVDGLNTIDAKHTDARDRVEVGSRAVRVDRDPGLAGEPGKRAQLLLHRRARLLRRRPRPDREPRRDRGGVLPREASQHHGRSRSRTKVLRRTRNVLRRPQQPHRRPTTTPRPEWATRCATKCRAWTSISRSSPSRQCGFDTSSDRS